MSQKKKIRSMAEMRIEIENERGIPAAAEYFSEHKDLNVPEDYVCPDGFQLGQWLSKTRARYAKGKVSSDVIEHLNEMHFMWERPKKKRGGRKSMALADCQDGINHAAEYARTYHHLNVPADYISEDGFALGKWIRSIRGIYQNGKLPQDVTDQLEKLGMLWKGQRQVWFDRCLELKAFYEKYGHLHIPQEQAELRKWFTSQRGIYRRAGFSAEKVKFLEENGILELFQMEIRYGMTKVSVQFDRADYEVMLKKAHKVGCETVEEYLLKLMRED